MANLDLVITTDTSIPHLAGALGCPVFTALKRVPDWRWMAQGEGSPWYPSMRLFRQSQRGAWPPVFAAIAAAVEARMAEAAA
jgi:ADP-heptose:LPS heptosyltransferase